MTSVNSSVPVTTSMGATSTTQLFEASSSPSSSTSQASTSSSLIDSSSSLMDTASIIDGSTSIVSPSTSSLEGSSTSEIEVSSSTDNLNSTLITVHISSSTTDNSTLSSSSHNSTSFYYQSLLGVTIEPLSSSTTSNNHSSSSHSSSSKSSGSSSTSPSSSLASSSAVSSSSSAALPSSSPTLASITYVYTQDYYITDDSTSFYTELPVTTILDADDSTFSTSAESTLTTDITFLENANPNYKIQSTSASSDDGSSSENTKTIAGSVVGSVCGVGLLLLALWWIFFRKKAWKSSASEKGFSHSIASTRHYDGTSSSAYMDEKSQKKRFKLISLLPSFHRTNSNTSSTASSDGLGLGLSSLRSSILNNQELPPQSQYHHASSPRTRSIPTVPSRQSKAKYNQNRTIDTVFEEAESINSSPDYTKHNPKNYNPQRYENSGLQPAANPFDEGRMKKTPPLPPPVRRANAYSAADDFHRYSVGSIESSIISEDTDDASTDESLIQYINNDHERGGDGNTTGLFTELV